MHGVPHPLLVTPTNNFVSCLDMRILLAQHLMHWQRQRLLDSLGIDLLGAIFALLGCGQQRVITAAEFGLQIAPGPAHRTCHRSTLFHIVEAGTMQFVFEVSPEASPLKTFRQKVTP
jgi:hypothetical protein